MVAYRLRIELPDRPGALAGVSAEIAASGANIVSIDVHEIDGSCAIDEIVVEVDEGWLPAALAASLAANSAGALLTSRRMDLREDPVTTALDAVAQMVAGGTGDVDRNCCRALLGLAHGSTAEVLERDDALRDPVAKVALERGATLVTKADALGSGWVLAAIDEPADPRVVGLVVRPFHVRFSATEVGRAEALLRIRRQLVGATAPTA